MTITGTFASLFLTKIESRQLYAWQYTVRHFFSHEAFFHMNSYTDILKELTKKYGYGYRITKLDCTKDTCIMMAKTNTS